MPDQTTSNASSFPDHVLKSNLADGIRSDAGFREMDAILSLESAFQRGEESPLQKRRSWEKVQAKIAAQQSAFLLKYASGRDNVTADDLAACEEVLRNAKDERPLQRFLASRPHMLAQHLGGGHGRWVIPQPQLGSEYAPDFLIAEGDSMGLHWVAVELESPTAKMFTKRGDPAEKLNHAIRQIVDWRTWLTKNIDYATRARDQGGLGLIDIDGNLPGLILIGRQGDQHEDDKVTMRRRRYVHDSRIAIHSFDWLTDGLQPQSGL